MGHCVIHHRKKFYLCTHITTQAYTWNNIPVHIIKSNTEIDSILVKAKSTFEGTVGELQFNPNYITFSEHTMVPLPTRATTLYVSRT
jgi:hypothetical protein